MDPLENFRLLSLLKQLEMLNYQFFELFASETAVRSVIKSHDVKISKLKRKINMIRTLLARRRLKRKNRAMWTISRSSQYWEKEVPAYTNLKFKEDFRMERKSFEYFKEKIRPYFRQRVDTTYRKCIPFDKRTAIFLYAIGSSAEYRTIATIFGVGRTTVGEIVREMSEVVWESMRADYLNTYPLTEDKLRELVEGFETVGFPQCCGCIDGCHIEVKPRKEEAVDYFNFKGWYSTVLFASVDYRCRFTYISVGTPGRCHDSFIFENSSLKKLHVNQPLLQQFSRNINGVSVPVVLLGDSAFQLSKFVMKPYPDTAETSEAETRFNEKLSSCRRLVENTFGQLKARFRRLGRGLELDIDNVSLVIKACCVIHNFLNEMNDSVWTLWLEEQKRNNFHEQPHRETTVGDREPTGMEIRRALTDYFSEQSQQ